MAVGPAVARRIRVQKRRGDVVELRALGLYFEQIAQHIAEKYDMPKYTRSDAHHDFEAGMAEITNKPAREYAANQAVDLMNLKRAHRRQAMSDPKVGDFYLRLLKREAELTGCDAPKRTEIEITAHFAALAQMVAIAVNAALNAIPELTVDQRTAARDAARGQVLALEAGPGQPQPQHVVIDADVTPPSDDLADTG